ncbi:GMC family oxidoreductase [Parvularcula marina]|uniref:GMC family oxidoreductase n=1 Tax=Parvularcula marina TaxID=2292771 RepID=A0A371RKQ6_9PROT|nr:GMC family oxidoreductase [Parvularcula marina]RFB06037.1 GMC family oxidoreductase [Parvularcula marina]
MQAEPEHDVVVIGSGAGGGMAAYVLTKAGVKVLMLEAGRNYDPLTETPMLHTNHQAPLRGAGTKDKVFGYYDATVDGGWEVPGEPYSRGEGSEFYWYRSRMLGGRTNHWARNSFRMGPYDFKPRSRDGLGVDWPVTYEDIAPYYDKTEALVGVYGRNDGLENHPNSGPGVLHDPPKARIPELLIQAAATDMGIPCVPARRAVMTRDLDQRKACYYASACGRGCAIGAAFQTTTSFLPWARATGNLTITTDAMVHEIEMGEDGKAKGVWYIEKKSGEHKFVPARIVILAASAGETARIMLNSKNAQAPDGVGNSSGQVGRNLMDTVGASMGARIPAFENRPRYNEDGAMGIHMYIPFWLYPEQAAGKLDFPRGYHYEMGGGFSQPDMGVGGYGDMAGGYGAKLKEEARRYYGSYVWFAQRGEMIPNEHCYAEIDPELKDNYGIPVLKFHYKHTEHELNQVAHFQKTTLELIDRMGGEVPTNVPSPKDAIAPGGWIIHEVGTARMGDDPGSSVTNEFGQSWDVDNLFLMDGAIFASKAHKNPTLTIMALAWRNTDYLVEQMQQGAL